MQTALNVVIVQLIYDNTLSILTDGYPKTIYNFLSFLFYYCDFLTIYLKLHLLVSFKQIYI